MSTARPVSQRVACRSCTVVLTDPTVKRAYGVGTGSYSQQKEPTDPIGAATVTFAGVQAGSEIRVFRSDGVELAGVESCVADQALSVPAFVAGSPNNTVRVVIVAAAYKIREFPFTLTGVGAQTLPVQQLRDPWYSNP